MEHDIDFRGYETSMDYGKLKELLDDGNKIIAFAYYSNQDYRLVTLQKAGPEWFDNVSYGFYGDDFSRNCYKNEDFYKFCRDYLIQYVAPTFKKKRFFKRLFAPEVCMNCGGENSIKLLGADDKGNNIYECKYCKHQYVLL